MKSPVLLNEFLSGAPRADCWRYDEGNEIVCAARGAAKNRIYLRAAVPAIALETDGDAFRFPPDVNQEVCDWCVFTIEGKRGYFVELKGSDFEHSLAQLSSTIGYMSRQYNIEPKKAFSVLNGAHPRNSRPGKANAKLRFKRKWPDVELHERTNGSKNTLDVVK